MIINTLTGMIILNYLHGLQHNVIKYQRFDNLQNEGNRFCLDRADMKETVIASIYQPSCDNQEKDIFSPFMNTNRKFPSENFYDRSLSQMSSIQSRYSQ